MFRYQTASGSNQTLETRNTRLHQRRMAAEIQDSNVGFLPLVLRDESERWSLTTLREKVVKIGAKVITHARYTIFQMAEVAVPRHLFRRVLDMIAGLRPRQVTRC
jgi:hypothetical protein